MMSVRELSGRELVACRGVELAARRQKVDGVEVHTRHGKGERGASKGANRGASEVLAFTRRGRRARARRRLRLADVASDLPPRSEQPPAQPPL